MAKAAILCADGPVIDVASRVMPAHRVATTLKSCHAADVFEQAYTEYGTPEIVHNDRSRQLTLMVSTVAVRNRGSDMSMDGIGAWRHNFFVERRWRTIKSEDIYLKIDDGVAEARKCIDRSVDGYNVGQPPMAACQMLARSIKLAAREGCKKLRHRAGRSLQSKTAAVNNRYQLETTRFSTSTSAVRRTRADHRYRALHQLHNSSWLNCLLSKI